MTQNETTPLRQLELRYEIFRGFGIGHNDAAVGRMPREQDGALVIGPPTGQRQLAAG